MGSGGLREHLRALGLANSTDREAVARAKREYYREYQRRWVQEKRNRCRKFLLYFSSEEFRLVSAAAKRHKRAATAFIKEACLAYIAQRFLVPDLFFLNCLREGITGIVTGVQDMADSRHIERRNARDILERVTILEQLCLRLLIDPAPLEDRLLEEIAKDGAYGERILDLLQKHMGV